ncbi:MAG: hypothetical protein SFZ03_11765 [Candidatus Melainabacteria bacterium]|nr:hypothetical protein [Candidatus Melainabacteria bacterium]
MTNVIKNWIEFPEPVVIPVKPEPKPEATLQPLLVPQILPL